MTFKRPTKNRPLGFEKIPGAGGGGGGAAWKPRKVSKTKATQSIKRKAKANSLRKSRKDSPNNAMTRVTQEFRQEKSNALRGVRRLNQQTSGRIDLSRHTPK